MGAMFAVYIAVCIAVLLVRAADGCSPVQGQPDSASVEKDVYYADIVAIGTVTHILSDDPKYRFEFDAYGANVNIRCSYKGESIPENITIVGAGFISGHCTSKDLENGKRYILFLRQESAYYEQTASARPDTEVNSLLSVCDLELKNLHGESNADKPETCAQPKDRSSCKRFVRGGGPTIQEDELSARSGITVAMGASVGDKNGNGGSNAAAFVSRVIPLATLLACVLGARAL